MCVRRRMVETDAKDLSVKVGFRYLYLVRWIYYWKNGEASTLTETRKICSFLAHAHVIDSALCLNSYRIAAKIDNQFDKALLMMVAYDSEPVIREEVNGARTQALYVDSTGDRRHPNYAVLIRNYANGRGGRLQLLRQSEERRLSPRGAHWYLHPEVARAAPAA